MECTSIIKEEVDLDCINSTNSTNEGSVEKKINNPYNSVSVTYARNAGESYINKHGKLVPARSMKAKCQSTKCKLDCNKITDEQRQTIFKYFWNIPDRFQKRLFISRNIELITRRKLCRRKYFFTVENQRIQVCCKNFLSTLDITYDLVQKMFKKVDKEFHKNRHRNNFLQDSDDDSDVPEFETKYSPEPKIVSDKQDDTFVTLQENKNIENIKEPEKNSNEGIIKQEPSQLQSSSTENSNEHQFETIFWFADSNTSVIDKLEIKKEADCDIKVEKEELLSNDLRFKVTNELQEQTEADYITDPEENYNIEAIREQASFREKPCIRRKRKLNADRGDSDPSSIKRLGVKIRAASKIKVEKQSQLSNPAIPQVDNSRKMKSCRGDSKCKLPKEQKQTIFQHFWSIESNEDRKRKMRTPCDAYDHNCRQISEKQRHQIFSDFWSISDNLGKYKFISNFVEWAPKKSGDSNGKCNLNYFLEIDGKRERVCQLMFEATIDINDYWIKTALEELGLYEVNNREVNDLQLNFSVSDTVKTDTERKRSPSPVSIKAKKLITERQRAFEAGESYMDADGTLMLGRSVKEGCDDVCVFNCQSLEKQQRQKIFKDFWSIPDRSKKYEFLSRLIEVCPIQKSKKLTIANKWNSYRKYFFEINGKLRRVCELMFTSTLDINHFWINKTLMQFGGRAVVSVDNENDMQIFEENIADSIADFEVEIMSKEEKNAEKIEQNRKIESRKNSHKLSESDYVKGKKIYTDLTNLKKLHEEKVRNQLAFETGLPYVNSHGLNRPGRKIKKACEKCRYYCNLIPDEERQKIFHDFWRITERSEKYDYLARHVKICTTEKVSRKYFFNINGKFRRVCQKMFKSTLDISQIWIDYLEPLKKKNVHTHVT